MMKVAREAAGKALPARLAEELWDMLEVMMQRWKRNIRSAYRRVLVEAKWTPKHFGVRKRFADGLVKRYRSVVARMTGR